MGRGFPPASGPGLREQMLLGWAARTLRKKMKSRKQNVNRRHMAPRMSSLPSRCEGVFKTHIILVSTRRCDCCH